LVGYGKKVFHKPPQALARKRFPELNLKVQHMTEKKLKIDFLEYVYKNNGEYKNVETKTILIKHFKNDNNPSERLEMKRFLKFLVEDNLISIESNNGIYFSTVEGRRIPKEEISAIVRLKPKAIEFLKENEKHVKYKFSFYLSLLFGISSCFLGWNNFILNDANKTLSKENINLTRENAALKASLKYYSTQDKRKK